MNFENVLSGKPSQIFGLLCSAPSCSGLGIRKWLASSNGAACQPVTGVGHKQETELMGEQKWYSCQLLGVGRKDGRRPCQGKRQVAWSQPVAGERVCDVSVMLSDLV